MSRAILYLQRTGCSWRALPDDFPKWRTRAFLLPEMDWATREWHQHSWGSIKKSGSCGAPQV